MNSSWRIVLTFVVISVLVLPCKSQKGEPQVTPRSEWTALMQSMEKMHMEMASVTPSASGDIDFVRLMLPHHEAAIDMAEAQLKYGTDAQMRRLSQEIITDQQSEIVLMQLWLRQHGRNAQAPAIQKEQ